MADTSVELTNSDITVSLELTRGCPFDGQTVAEAALPRLQTLLVDGSRALLGIPANVD